MNKRLFKCDSLSLTLKLKQRVVERSEHLNCNPGTIDNVYLTDSDEEAIVDFVKDHEEL